MIKENLIFAIPSKGRFMEESCSLLEEAGLQFILEERKLAVPARFQGSELTLALMRPRDIAKFVATEQVQLGIIGSDTLSESQSRGVQRLLNLGIGRCNLVLAASKAEKYQTSEEMGSEWQFLKQFSGARIATSYRGIIETYFDDWEVSMERNFAAQSIPRSYVNLDGAVEVAPALGLADIVADLVETGSTMEANGLRVLGTVFRSEGVLVTTPSNKKGDNPLLDSLRDSLFDIMLRQGNPDALERQQSYAKLSQRVALFR